MRPALKSIVLLGCALTCISTTNAQQPLTWQMQNSNTTASLRGIDSVDGNTAWASGTEGTILKTQDGGEHWTQCATPPDASILDFRGIQAWDATTAIAMSSGPGEKSRLFKTTDGCKTWTLLFKNPDAPDGFFDSFWIDEHGTGLLLGDPVHGSFAVYWTHDQGAHWQQDQSENLSQDADKLGGFAASNSLILHEESDSGQASGVPVLFAVGGKGGSFLYLHSIGSNCTAMLAHDDPAACKKLQYSTWQQIGVPIAHGLDTTGIFSIGLHQNFADPAHMTPEQKKTGFRQVWMAVGGDYAKPNENGGTAAWSDDGGQTWFAAKQPPHGYRFSVAWSGALHAWITAGTNGSDISRDDGYTWTSFPNDETANGNWNALSLPFAVGPKGRIAKLTQPVAFPAAKK